MVRIPDSKIVVPALPAEFTPRRQLLEHLDRAGAAQVVVVIAPPGYGKTLLLADWVSRPGGPPTAWVSLDAGDDSPRLWAAVLAALRAIPDVPADSALHRIGRGGFGAAGPDVVDGLAAALDAIPTPVRLVLDDVQVLTSAEPLRDLARLIRLRPAGLRLVLSSRVDPPLSLPRLRLEGRLHELRADGLRFTQRDAAELIRASGVELTGDQVAMLHTRTEGWVAGLRLAALALRRSDDRDGFIADFSGDERSVADYLTGEVLAGLAAPGRYVLSTTAVCSSLQVGLAVELSGQPDVARMLDELAHETALVQRNGADAYRIHTLLRTYLRADLQRHRPALHRRLQAVAAQWWAGAGDTVHALRHAERAGDPVLVAALLRDSGVGLIASGEFAALRRGLAAAAGAAQVSDPWLALLAALAHVEVRDLADAATALDRARRAWPAFPQPSLVLLRSAVQLLVTGQSEPVVGDRAAAHDLAALLGLSRAAAALAAPTGDPDTVRAELDDVLTLARERGFGYFEAQAASLLAVLEASRGRYRAMASAAESAVAAAAREGRHPSGWSGCASALLAYGELLGGNPAAARARAAEALAAPHAQPAEARFALGVMHGTALCDMGERAAGLAQAREARAAFGDRAAPAALLVALGVLEHRAALLQGNPGAAAEAARWLERRVGKAGEILLMEAWTQLAAGHHEAARATLEPVRAGSIAALLAHTPVDVHLVCAEAALRAEDPAAGQAELDAALALGAVLPVVRPFALAGPLTRELLPARVAGWGSGRFADRLASALASIRADAATPLSERELAVLALLPSLLSAGEIAGELTVSVNTVKSHIRAIYAKLGVSNRREAVLRAHERGLLG